MPRKGSCKQVYPLLPNRDKGDNNRRIVEEVITEPEIRNQGNFLIQKRERKAKTN